MATTLSRSIKDAILDGITTNDSPFENVGTQTFLKFDSFNIGTDGVVTFNLCGKHVFSIAPDGEFKAGKDVLTIHGVEGRMRVSL